MKLAYLANIRLPTEKAHGLQIMQMCEAFAQTVLDDHAVEVTLYAARRVNTAEMQRISDAWAFYGVARIFAIRRVTCIDLYCWLNGRAERLAFSIQSLSYLSVLCLTLLLHQADLYYSRDPLTLLALSLFKRRATLCYEAHQVVNSGIGRRLQSLCVRRVGTVVAITAGLGQRMRERGARNVIVAHDGIRAARFAVMPSQAEARRSLGLPAEAFIVGYAGRFHTLGMSKGIDTLIDAIAQLAPDPILLYLVGGPHDWVDRFCEQWSAHHLPPDQFIYAGSVLADQVPLHLAACDVCTMPLPWTEHFAYYASSMKLFEYMAAGRAILATELPSVIEVVQDDHSTLLARPGDPTSMARALRRLKDDPALRARLAAQAQSDVKGYHWSRRAETILRAIQGAPR